MQRFSKERGMRQCHACSVMNTYAAESNALIVWQHKYSKVVCDE